MKDSLSDFALAGATPAFAEKLHVGRPNIGDRTRLLERINTALDTRWLTNSGPFEREFERRIADFTGAAHCIATCNATLALELAIRALGLRGEVIVPSFTFIATAHALQWQAITPVFCDIDPATYNLDPLRVEQLITPNTTAILPVHVFGRPCDIDSLAEIAARRGLKLLFDAAHAFGCSYHGRTIGTFGDAEVFSFHATKAINSFEGGAVLTNDRALADEIRLLRNFGFSGYDETAHLGTNAKMTEVCAAMGLTSLEALDEIIAVNRRNWGVYRAELMDLNGISLVEYDPKEKSTFHYVVIEVHPEEAALDRDELLTVLQAENVLARRYFWPGCHRMEPYRSADPKAHLRLPQTERVAAQVMTLPTGQAITPDVITKVCNIIRAALKNARPIRKLLREQAAI